jgi:hypothetical protein
MIAPIKSSTRLRIPLLFLLITSLIFPLTLGGPVANAQTPDTVNAKKVTTAPTIDGALNETDWSLATSVAKTTIGTPNNTVTFGVLWNSTNLYVGVKVLDANLFNDSVNIWDDDSVEIYIDANHNHGTVYDSFDRQFTKGYNDGALGGAGSQTGVVHAWAAITGGYSVELAIPWSNLGVTPTAGMTIGFDVGYNDDDNGGARDAQAVWFGNINDYTNTSAFGHAFLQAPSGPTATPTATFTRTNTPLSPTATSTFTPTRTNTPLGPTNTPTRTFTPAPPTNTPTRTNTPTTSGQAPFGGTAWAIPGTVQAENFDTGGEGVAYHDLEVANQGGQYRTSEGVDVETTTDTGGGYNVGWVRTDEWVEYTVNVATAGSYTLVARVASGVGTGSFHVEFNGVDKTGVVAVASTGGWQTWTNISRTVSLSAGQQVMRVYMNSTEFNLNYLTFTSGGATATPTPTATRTNTPTGPTATAPPGGTLSKRVHLFYYPWYGNPTFNGSWVHWNGSGHTPPNDITSNFYPSLGAYDSGDYAGAVTQHMQWIQRSGAGVISLSWWGQGSYEDQHARQVMDVANQYGIKVDWHIEPYGNRTAASVVSDINYINAQYGSHPAFFRDSLHGNKPVFYIFYSLQIVDWSALDQVNGSNIIFAQTTDLSRVAHFGGIYTYGGMDMTSSWTWLNDYCHSHGMLWAPSVQPGYIDDRAVPGNTVPNIDRNNGSVYDAQWSRALDPAQVGSPDYVTVTSFNEWHEGTQIEPARNTPPSGFGYLTYLNAYGRTDATAELAYIDRTKYWVSQFSP